MAYTGVENDKLQTVDGAGSLLRKIISHVRLRRRKWKVQRVEGGRGNYEKSVGAGGVKYEIISM